MDCDAIVYDASPRGGDSMLTLIDTDPGLDDALALLLAWSSPELRLAGITTVAGNVPVDVATENLFRLMSLRGITGLPVARGAAAPLNRPLVTAKGYHGDDGLGDLPDWPPTRSSPIPEPAAAWIAGVAGRATEPLTLIALGPLTNVALALEQDAGSLRQLERVVVMGGAVDVRGNVTATTEFNIHVDPAAAARVLAAGLPVDLVPLDATRQALLSRAELEAALQRRAGPIADRIAAFTRRGFGPWAGPDTSVMVQHDALAVAVAIDPTLVQWETTRLVIGPDGETRRAPGPPNCRVAGAVDVRRFLAMFLDRLCPAS
jgi:inosine-uridine nucleoside N-ribohydrolase